MLVPSGSNVTGMLDNLREFSCNETISSDLIAVRVIVHWLVGGVLGDELPVVLRCASSSCVCFCGRGREGEGEGLGG